MRLPSLSGVTWSLLRRCLLGGRRRWWGTVLVLVLGRLLQRLSKLGTAPVVFKRALKPGEGVLVSHLSEDVESAHGCWPESHRGSA